MKTINKSKLSGDLLSAYDKIQKLKEKDSVKGLEMEQKFISILDKKNHESIVSKPIKKSTTKKATKNKTAKKTTGVAKRRTVMTVAKEIRKKDESWQDALKRAKLDMNKSTKKQVTAIDDELSKLKNLIKNDKNLKGFKGSDSDLIRDASRKALPKGKRISKKGGKNQHGTSKGGRVYYENRENRSDRYAPKYPKDKPYLKYGGDVMSLGIANADAVYSKGGKTYGDTLGDFKKRLLELGDKEFVEYNEKQLKKQDLYYAFRDRLKNVHNQKIVIKDDLPFEKGGEMSELRKGQRVRIFNTQYDGKQGLIVAGETDGKYSVQLEDGKVKGIERQNLMLLSRDIFSKGGKTQDETLAYNFNREDIVKNVLFWKNDVIVEDKNGKAVRIDLDKGERIELNAKGGEINTSKKGVYLMELKDGTFRVSNNLGNRDFPYEFNDVFTTKERAMKFANRIAKNSKSKVVEIKYAKGGEIESYDEFIAREDEYLDNAFNTGSDEYKIHNKVQQLMKKDNKWHPDYRGYVDETYYEYYKKAKGFAKGGEIDLFEDYQSQPKELSEIVEKYEERYADGDMDYKDTEKFLKEVNAIGYTFDSGLDNEPYNLRPMMAKGGEITKTGNKGSARWEMKITDDEGNTSSIYAEKKSDLLQYKKMYLAKGGDVMSLGISNADAVFKKGGELYTPEEAMEFANRISKKLMAKGGETEMPFDDEVIVRNSFDGDRKKYKKYQKEVERKRNEPLPFAKGGEITKTGNKGSARWEMKITDDEGNTSSIYAEKKSDLLQYKKMYLAKGGAISSIKKNNDLSIHDSYYAKGGLTDSKYIPSYEIYEVVTKDGKVYENDYSAMQFLSGAYVSDKVVTKPEEKDGSQMTLFDKGGKIPKGAIYIKRRDIDFITVGEYEDDKEKISGKNLFNGFWIDPKKQKTLISEAIKDGRLGKSKANKMAKGGRTISIVNDGVNFDKSKYKAVYGDFDKDGTVNIDDANPLDSTKKNKVEQVELKDTFDKLLGVKAELDNIMYDAVDTLDKKAPKDADIYARTKTPYSILKKLVEKRMLDPEKGLTDMIGTTIAVDSQKELENVRDDIDGGLLGKVLDKDDYYKSPKAGYRAYHYIVEYKGVPVEVQLKTKNMKKLHEVSHEAYKNGTLNAKSLDSLSKTFMRADKGDAKAKAEISKLLSDKKLLASKVSKSTMAKGGKTKTKKPNSFFAVVKREQKEGESWKDAIQRVKKQKSVKK